MSPRERPQALLVFIAALVTPERRRGDIVLGIRRRLTDRATSLGRASALFERGRRSIGAVELAPFPLVVASSAIGLLLVVVAYARSRSTTSSSQVLFWFGLVVIFPHWSATVSRPGEANLSEPRLENSGIHALPDEGSARPVRVHLQTSLPMPEHERNPSHARALPCQSVLPVTAYFRVSERGAALATLADHVTGAGLIVIGTAQSS